MSILFLVQLGPWREEDILAPYKDHLGTPNIISSRKILEMESWFWTMDYEEALIC